MLFFKKIFTYSSLCILTSCSNPVLNGYIANVASEPESTNKDLDLDVKETSLTSLLNSFGPDIHRSKERAKDVYFFNPKNKTNIGLTNEEKKEDKKLFDNLYYNHKAYFDEFEKINKDILKKIKVKKKTEEIDISKNTFIPMKNCNMEQTLVCYPKLTQENYKNFILLTTLKIQQDYININKKVAKKLGLKNPYLPKLKKIKFMSGIRSFMVDRRKHELLVPYYYKTTFVEVGSYKLLDGMIHFKPMKRVKNAVKPSVYHDMVKGRTELYGDNFSPLPSKYIKQDIEMTIAHEMAHQFFPHRVGVLLKGNENADLMRDFKAEEVIANIRGLSYLKEHYTRDMWEKIFLRTKRADYLNFLTTYWNSYNANKNTIKGVKSRRGFYYYYEDFGSYEKMPDFNKCGTITTLDNPYCSNNKKTSLK